MPKLDHTNLRNIVAEGWLVICAYEGGVTVESFSSTKEWQAAIEKLTLQGNDKFIVGHFAPSKVYVTIEADPFPHQAKTEGSNPYKGQRRAI